MDIFDQQLAIAVKKSGGKLSANEQALLAASDIIKNLEKRLSESELVPLDGLKSQIASNIELRVFSGERGEDLRNISRMTLAEFGYIGLDQVQKAFFVAESLSECIDLDSELDEYKHVQLVINWQYVNI